MAKSAAEELDGVWMSVSGLARRDGVSKEAISKRVAALPNVSTRTNPRDRRELLVNVVEFDRAAGESVDAANDLRTATAPGPRAEAVDGSTAIKVYQARRAQQAGYDAEFSRLDLEEKVGHLADRRLAEDHSFDVMRRLRDRTMALPAAISERLLASTDERTLRLALEDALREVLDQAADEFDQVYRAKVADAA